MEPNKSYPLHPDQDDQSPTPSTPPVSSSDNIPLTPPSDFDSSQQAAPEQPKPVPWYLKPLTKTTQSPLTATQTRPYVPREPLPMSRQQSKPSVQSTQPSASQSMKSPAATAPSTAETSPVSPFRVQPLPPLRSPYASISEQNSIYRPPPEKQSKPAQRSFDPTSVSVPKPFSQFGTDSSSKPAAVYEPVATPKKQRRIIGIAAVILLVGAIGSGVYSLWQNNRSDSPAVTTPVATDKAREERFYQAIERQLQTSFVRQTYTQTTEGADNDVVTLDTVSDFSDPANPKSHIRYDLQSGSGDDVVNGSGEIIVVDKNEYFANLSKPVLFYQGEEVVKPIVNQWYRIATDDVTGEALVDPMSTRTSLNTSLGEMPIGNFQDDLRQELMQFITGRNVYAVKNSSDITEDDKKLTYYNVEFNAELVNELNEKIADALNFDNSQGVINYAQNDVRNMEVWVSSETGQITKIKFNREYAAIEGASSPIKETVSVVIGYLRDGSTIKVPEDAVTGTWVSNQP